MFALANRIHFLHQPLFAVVIPRCFWLLSPSSLVVLSHISLCICPRVPGLSSLRRVVEVAPLSTLVGEWSLATTDCARWLNGYGTGSRYDGTFEPYEYIGTCQVRRHMYPHLSCPFVTASPSCITRVVCFSVVFLCWFWRQVERVSFTLVLSMLTRLALVCLTVQDQNNHAVWGQDYKDFLRKFAEKQMSAYETGSASGWFFWK